MPYVQNNNIAVRYETAGNTAGQPLVLIFGISMCCEDWFELGYVERLSEDFGIICIEPRGHGKSSCPVDPSSYALSAMTTDVEAIITALRLKRPLIWGYSLGAKIALATAGRDPAAYAGLILGGLELHSKVDLTNDVVADTLAQGPRAWLSLWTQMFSVPHGMASRLAAANTQALRALRTAEAQWWTLESVAERFIAPVLLYAGERCFFRDATVAAAERFQTARYLERPGRDHFDLMPDSAWIVDEVIRQFAPGR